MHRTPAEILHHYWGFDQFRGSQEEIINAIYNGSDVLALLPTGGGKSICFQVPAMMQEGICVVISPLIALIENQVDTLQKLGIKALGLRGGLKFAEVDSMLDNCIYGNYKFLYLSPERLQQELVQERIRAMNVTLFVIDEAHCISQWGHDFRPAYLNCATLRTLHPGVPMVALTATATKRVSDDILHSLQLKNPLFKKDSFYRKNIGFGVISTEDKNNQLKRYCAQLKHSAIIYVRSRRVSEEVSGYLIKNGFKATYYHGGIDQKTKTKRLNSWLTDNVKIMVATNAFGMGIDKPDVALVIHYQIPDSLENYFQEAGRAGRNGALAKAVMLTNTADKILVKRQFLEVLPDVAFVKMVYKKLTTYFQIGIQEFTDARYLLNFNAFCDRYALNSYITYNALLVLDRNSVISLSENFNKKSILKFTTDKDTLFRYIRQNQLLENFIKVVLRTYGGVFEFETQVNTYLIAKKIGIPESVVDSNFQQLVKDEIITYQSTHSDLELLFLVPRDDDRTINRFSHTIVEQNQIKIEKVSKILEYIENEDVCRSVQLLAYFGEKQGKVCGICDVCRRNKTTGLVTEDLKAKTLRLLEKGSATSKKLQHNLNIEQEELIRIIQELLEENSIRLNTRNEYELI
ncbi:MAG: RecQ family ATP-dependent DNA helicase [Maribacter sp.]